MIVGLGNPGEPYSSSRHNIGFHVADWFRSAFGFPPEISKLEVTCTENTLNGERVVLVKPQSFMNLSGPALRGFLEAESLFREVLGAAGEPCGAAPGAEFTAPTDCLLVVHDDLDLPFGKLRFKARGTSGGHRGVDSLIDALGTDAFSRLKVGIGREQGTEARDYVLEPLEGKDRESLREAAAHAGKTLDVWIRKGVRACACQFNGPAGEMKAES